jgi:hypothetical protein
MATQNEIAGGASGALGAGAAALPGAFAIAALPIPGARLAAIGMVGVQMGLAAAGGVQEESAKSAAKVSKDAMMQDKEAQKIANQRAKTAQRGKQDDALLASSMGGASTQATTGTQYDRFQADTFGLG